ncbi:MAG TPA: PHP domain-containing protein [Candidatus Saccharimonadales bacterium]|jgi:predicted metal-dependent phosphoesterase TrpH|nr:PHP domain-containing protein [Candidatus Saccharimonadales bacterium]
MIDLHTHTNSSDGSSSPSDLLRASHKIGLKALAITDHDTLAGFDAALPLARECGVELICGIELSTQLENPGQRRLSVHVLGYFLHQPPGDEFRNWLTSISATRRQRNLELMERLRGSNINISWEDFAGLGPERAARPHFARVLVAKGYVPNSQSAFDLYLSDAALAGIERELPSPPEAIQRIRQNGGIASLAHPGRLGLSPPSALKALIGKLIPYGLGAIEAYHSDHTPEETSVLLQVAEEFNLPVTGGSDFHGANKPDIHLGSGRHGNVRVPDEVLERMRVLVAVDGNLET